MFCERDLTTCMGLEIQYLIPLLVLYMNTENAHTCKAPEVTLNQYLSHRKLAQRHEMFQYK